MSATEKPPAFAIKHEIFVLDANLSHALDETKQTKITRALIDDLLRVLQMEPLGKLEIYPALDLRAPGWSFIQPITTSHISGHYFEKPGKHPHIHVDVYSCESVDYGKVVTTLNEHLDLADWRGNFIVRGWDDTRRQAFDILGDGAEILSETELVPRSDITGH